MKKYIVLILMILFVLPLTACGNMKNKETYKFIIFNKKRFEKWFQEYSQ